MCHTAVVAVIDTDINTGVGENDKAFLRSTVDDAKHADVIQIDVLISRMQFDACDVMLPETPDFFFVIGIVRVQPAKGDDASGKKCFPVFDHGTVDFLYLFRTGHHREIDGITDTGFLHGSGEILYGTVRVRLNVGGDSQLFYDSGRNLFRKSVCVKVDYHVVIS